MTEQRGEGGGVARLTLYSRVRKGIALNFGEMLSFGVSHARRMPPVRLVCRYLEQNSPKTELFANGKERQPTQKNLAHLPPPYLFATVLLATHVII